jgi:class 3 adenylate cyclase/tetratricopeptide (TPR) repeat protein
MSAAEDMCRWLRTIGLEELAETLAANDIDLDLMPELSDEDLKELGLSLGHRRRLLRAIGKMASAQPSPVAPPAARASDSGPAADGAAREAERRQLTVMFCDLVGSTELSRLHDPEDLREVLRRYHDTVTAVVQGFGGYVANYLGDGILAYFGWPRAEEDEAAQAVRAGLAAIAAAKKLSLQVHVGIASGTVVVGDIDGGGRRQAGAIAGETPNLAARLETLAGPDQVVIGELTRQLIGEAFILDELGPQEVKGIAEPIPAWQVLAERSVESRFETRAGRLTRFVGREHEVALLLDRFERAVAGEGQAVLLSGEAGIGKSRIVTQLHENLSPTPHTRLRFQCSPSHTDIALYPVIRHLYHAAGFQPVDGPEARLDKLEALLRQGADDIGEGAALLAPLLSLPGEPRYGTIALTAEQRTERLFKVLVGQLLGLAARQPVLYILEDAHWIDPATRELVTRTLGRIADARVLLLITHRPDFQPDWVRHPQVTALTLSRLSRGQGAAVARVIGGAALPEVVVTRILERADGVPLFIEELTRSVIETDELRGDTDIPRTLQASLLARLDRLGPDVADIAKLAAVIGREFGGALLAAVAGKPQADVDDGLAHLVASEIVLPQGPAQDSVYAFRHALIQDAAYQSLLMSRRREYHEAIAHVLERHFPEIAEGQPEVIARHYTAAGSAERAIAYWLRAGERSRLRYATQEAIAHLERGVQMARALPDGSERSRHLLALLLVLGETQLLISHRLAQALATFREAAELARDEQRVADFVRAALGADEAEATLGFLLDRPALTVLQTALQLLGESDSVERSRVLSRIGRALAQQGDTHASALLTDAAALARRCGDPRALYDALYAGLVIVSGRACPAAKFAERRRNLEEMQAAAEKNGDPAEIIQTDLWRASSFLELGDHAAFADSLIHLNEFVERYQISYFGWGLACADALRAILYGQFAEAEQLAEKAFELSGEVHGDLASGVYGVQMFTIRREQGRLAEVAGLFRRFVDENPGDRTWRPGLALIASDLGFEDAARKAFDDMAAIDGFAQPDDAKRGLTLSYLAEVCARLGDAARAEQLYEQLLPYRDNMILAPVATVCCGAAARFLGMLAGVGGDWARVEEHFEAALDIDERMHAWPWLAHTQYEFAALILRRGKAEDRWRADLLLSTAAETAVRLGMPALRKQISALQH